MANCAHHKAEHTCYAICYKTEEYQTSYNCSHNFRMKNESHIIKALQS